MSQEYGLIVGYLGILFFACIVAFGDDWIRYITKFFKKHFKQLL